MATSHPTSRRKAAEPTAADNDHDVILHELAASRRSDAVLRDFIDTATIGLHRVGADGTILWANQAELDLLGYTKEEYVGWNIAEFHADEPVINDMPKIRAPSIGSASNATIDHLRLGTTS